MSATGRTLRPGRPGPRMPDRPNSGLGPWKAITSPFEQASALKGGWQVVNSVGAYVGLWYLLYHAAAFSWLLTIPLAALAGGFLVRIFIILHDCGHGSFFPSRRANDVVGTVAGFLTFTPYRHWTWTHAVHHATTGDLDRRGMGDIWTMTVEEYSGASLWKRAVYRVARHPLVLFGLAPLALFMMRHRFSSRAASVRERRSVWVTNLAVAAMAGMLVRIFGLGPYLLIQLTVMVVAGSAGVWLFYVQHQFEDAYWERSAGWEWAAAALKGSSFYRLPGLLRWFTGSIGFHHIHHLSSRIPNYNLARCHAAHPLFEEATVLTLKSSLATARLRLWDERAGKLVTFRGCERAGRGELGASRVSFLQGRRSR